MDRTARLLLTRPEAASRRFLEACEARMGVSIPALVSPVMAIRPIGVLLPGRPAAVILTSENGAARAGDLGLRGMAAWCVGPRTAEVACAAGLRPIEAGPDAEGLVQALLAARPPGLLLHLRGEHARGDVVERLRNGGLIAMEAVVYRQEAQAPGPAARAALDGPGPLVVPLFSPRSAVLLADWEPAAALHVIAISPAVAEAARVLCPESLALARSPNGDAMVETTVARLARLAEPRLEANGRAD